MEQIETISIITICRNAKCDLQRTMDSVLAQTYQHIEYIIVDGASTDGTDGLLAQYRRRISRIISEPDDGVYDAMNKGLKYATGEWVIMMNAGDTFHTPQTLNDIFAPGIPEDKAFIYSDFLLQLPDGKTLYRQCDRSRALVHHQNAIYRRALHNTYGYYIVTRPIIVSDLLFFMAIPQRLYMKVPIPIAIIKAGGLSDAFWSFEQLLCVQIIYCIKPFPKAIIDYTLMRTRMTLSKFKHFSQKCLRIAR